MPLHLFLPLLACSRASSQAPQGTRGAHGSSQDRSELAREGERGKDQGQEGEGNHVLRIPTSFLYILD